MNMLDDWPRVRAVFEQAIALEEPERSAFLAVLGFVAIRVSRIFCAASGSPR